MVLAGSTDWRRIAAGGAPCRQMWQSWQKRQRHSVVSVGMCWVGQNRTEAGGREERRGQRTEKARKGLGCRHIERRKSKVRYVLVVRWADDVTTSAGGGSDFGSLGSAMHLAGCPRYQVYYYPKVKYVEIEAEVVAGMCVSGRLPFPPNTGR